MSILDLPDNLKKLRDLARQADPWTLGVGVVVGFMIAYGVANFWNAGLVTEKNAQLDSLRAVIEVKEARIEHLESRVVLFERELTLVQKAAKQQVELYADVPFAWPQRVPVRAPETLPSDAVSRLNVALRIVEAAVFRHDSGNSAAALSSYLNAFQQLPSEVRLDLDHREVEAALAIENAYDLESIDTAIGHWRKVFNAEIVHKLRNLAKGAEKP